MNETVWTKIAETDKHRYLRRLAPNRSYPWFLVEEKGQDALGQPRWTVLKEYDPDDEDYVVIRDLIEALGKKG